MRGGPRTDKRCKPLSEVSYKRFHQILADQRGKATNFPCIDCNTDEGRREWSHRFGTEERVVENYDVRCVSCHRKIDDNQPSSRVAKAKAMKNLWDSGRKEYINGRITK